jgi:DNA-binding transcriptional LysR family regulator
VELSVAQLRHFLHVVDTGSFRAAAERAHRSQPALSLSIKDLEHRLGQPLFQRTKPAQLTPFAQDCLPFVRDFVAAHERACESLGRLASGESGSVSVASVMTATTHWLSDVVPEFARIHPDVSVRLVDENSTNIEKLVAAGTIDFGVCSQVSTGTEQFVFEPLARDAFGLVCRHDHALARRRSIDWDALVGQALVGTTTHRSLAAYAQAAPLQQPAMYVENMSALLALLDRGNHITVLPALAVPPYATGLTFVRLKNPTVERELGILSLRGRVPRPPAAAMMDMVRARAAHVSKIAPRRKNFQTRRSAVP